MKKLILRILLQSALMFTFVIGATGVAALCFEILPSPLDLIMTFLGWVFTGILWQETALRFPRLFGLERKTPQTPEDTQR